MATNIMSFEDFRGFLSDTLGVAESALMPDTSFLMDLAVDSLKMTELILQIELQLGIRVPTDAAWDILTVGDAYKYYVNRLRGGPSSTA